MKRRRSSSRSSNRDSRLAIRQSGWLYPLANVGHIVALVVFAGAVTVMDVRLLGGLAATEPGRLIGQARWVAILAFAVMVVTGAMLFAAEASHLVVNPMLQLKAVLLVAGLVNIAMFELWGKQAVVGLAPAAPTPKRAKVAGRPLARDVARGRGMREKHRVLLKVRCR